MSMTNALVGSRQTAVGRGLLPTADCQLPTEEVQIAPRDASARIECREFDVHALCIPAGAFTGDFFFVQRQGDDLWIALGDVAGKGLHAAVFMAMLQEELEQRIRSCALTECDPAVTMARLHEVLKDVLPANRFVTAVIARVSADGTLLIANAGHCPPLLQRSDGRIEQIDSTGPALGILSDSRWHSRASRLERGDALLLYSDGLVEARSSDGAEFGLLSARNVLSFARGASACQIAGSLRAAVDRHSGGVRSDDLTLLALRA
jgi:sigma-B regulation protein RsbU (phosphoserine phosphatase)